jgi:hypothetical protein
MPQMIRGYQSPLSILSALPEAVNKSGGVLLSVYSRKPLSVMSETGYVANGCCPLPWRGPSFLLRIEVRKTALSPGERVTRDRRFHQPARAG